MPFTVLVVDDEPLAREGLRLLLARDPDFAIVHEARNGREAVDQIRSVRPDLVLLDVQMPEMNGFAVVKEVGAAAMPVVVFVTAHDQYAIQAFEVNAIDYLLKPVTEARFTKALARTRKRLLAKPDTGADGQILSLLETIASTKRALTRLAVRSQGKTVFVNVDEIDWIEAAQNYVRLHAGKAEYLLHVSLSSLERSLDADTFLRIHRSTIINIRRIKEVHPMMHGEHLITLTTGARLQSGRLHSDRVKALLSNPF